LFYADDLSGEWVPQDMLETDERREKTAGRFGPAVKVLR